MHDFAGRRLPFLASGDLAVFESLFDRPKDWLDIANMVSSGSIDVRTVADALSTLLGDDSRVDRLLEQEPFDRPV